MKTYHIRWLQHLVAEYDVDAESEDDAIALIASGDLGDPNEIYDNAFIVDYVTETK